MRYFWCNWKGFVLGKKNKTQTINPLSLLYQYTTGTLSPPPYTHSHTVTGMEITLKQQRVNSVSETYYACIYVLLWYLCLMAYQPSWVI